MAFPTPATKKLFRSLRLARYSLRYCSIAQNYPACQAPKVDRHAQSQQASFAVSNYRIHHVNIDIVGLLPESISLIYLLTRIDRLPHWQDAFLVQPRHLRRTGLQHLVYHFHLTLTVKSSLNRLFYTKLAYVLGKDRFHITAYHPQASVSVDRFHRQLKADPQTFFKSKLTIKASQDLQ